MVQGIRFLKSAVLACVLIAAPAAARAQSASVQVTAGDARVFLAADASSTVVTPLPVGAVLEVVSRTGDWFQVRLPKDSSGFDRVGYVQSGKVREMTVASSAPAASSGNAAASAPRSARPTAAVLAFEFGAVDNWWGGTWDIGKGIADLLVEELLQTGQIRLLERAQIESVLAEQDLANSSRADVSGAQAARLGKVLGANLLLTGTVVQFGSEQRNVGGSAGSVAGRFMGGAGARNTTATVVITVRVIDTGTSEILASVKAEGKSNRRGLLLGSRVGGNFGSIDMGSSDFRETILGEATQKAVTEAATRLTTAMNNAR
jgi:curli biogenesis system outer membrane secretion channel CsgG